MNFKLDIDTQGVALITFDAEGRSSNTLTVSAQHELAAVVALLSSDEKVVGVVLCSGKPSNFCVGGDLDELSQMAGAGADADQALLERALQGPDRLNATLRALETCGKPVACAIAGHALGGGLELALAAHYRVVADNPKIKIGLPEATVGLMPGAGGTQRLPRLVGLVVGLDMIVEGKPVAPKRALELGLIHKVAPSADVVAQARTWVLSQPDARQPWDQDGFTPPGGGPFGPANLEAAGIIGSLSKRWHGNHPARENIARAVYEGIQVPIETGLKIEARYFVLTLIEPQTKAMIRTHFQSMQALRKGAAGVESKTFKKVGVLGAGMMGAGIACVQATAGIETVLLDVSVAAADRGKDHTRGLLAKQTSRGAMDQNEAELILSRIIPTDDYALLAGCDLVIEAVFEDREVKRTTIAKAEAHLSAGALFSSNTSTLPITGLAEMSRDPERFIGLHFFSPVDRMNLVEIILGERTGDAALSEALAYVKQIGKVPIVVHDSRGFYTSRCFDTYIREGMEMLAEGIAPAIIDNIGRGVGMPRGPLQVTDDVAIDLVGRIARQTAVDLGAAYDRPMSDDVIDTMLAQDRAGRKSGKGFYDYAAERTTLWPGLADLWPVQIATSTPELIETLRTRLLYRQAVEAARCMDEGVVDDPRHADVGAILAWGFSPWTGGPLSLIDAVGPAAFVKRCDELAAAHGSRFAPPPSLRRMAETGGRYYSDDPAPAAA